jgi:hypothetical protein
MRLLIAIAAVLALGVVASQASASTPTPTQVPCADPSAPRANLPQPRVSISPREAGYLVVDWIIISAAYDEPTCYVVQRQVDDGPFETVAITGFVSGWADPTYFDGAVTVTYRIYAGTADAISERGEASVSIPSHTPFVPAPSSLRGDVDCDQDVDGIDAVSLLEAISGVPVSHASDNCYLEPAPGEVFDKWWRWGRTDFNCDDQASLYDVIVLLRRIAGLPLEVHRFCAPSWPS